MRSFGLWIVYALLTFITIYKCFSGLQTNPIERWDETTNISVVQETANRQSFPVLYLSNAPFFEKPPLWYYLQLGLYISGLRSIEYFRLLSALCGLSIIMTCVVLAKKKWGVIAACVSWVVLLTTNHLFVINPENIFSTHNFKSADLDSLHIMLLLLSVICGIHMQRSHLLACLTGVLAGLSVLTKSPLGVLPLLILHIASHIQSKESIPNIGKTWICFFTIIVPWYLFMTTRFGLEFISLHIFYHIQTRTVVAIEGHNNPWWYYSFLLSKPNIFFASWLFPVLFIWTLIKGKITRDSLLLHCYLLCSLFFLIPTVMQTRLAWYILPFYPFAALIIGKSIQDIYNTVTKRI